MIRLITDSASNLPRKWLNEHNVRQIPLSYTVDGAPVDYPTDEDFDGGAFYAMMRLGADVRTSMVNRTLFEDCFREILAAGDTPLYISISGGISGTAMNAKNALDELLREEFQGREGVVLDSLGASLGEGMLVMEAAKRIEAGCTLPALLQELTTLRGQMSQFFTVDDLRYLRKSGRISGAVALVGQALQIKPILKGNAAGQIVQDGKARGSRKVLDTLAERYDTFISDRSSSIGIAHADNAEGVEYLLGKLKEKGFSGDCLTVMYEPVTGSHVGPGTVAMFFFGGGR